MISLLKPNIIDYPDKTPVPLDGSFNYNLLPSDRRFEELIYTIYKQKIQNEEVWNNLFDEIYLTAASGDSGADCILYKNGKACGVIQCKKYGSNLTKPEVAKEILKFVLYTIADKSLMPNPQDYHYYFAVSKGFSKPAIDLIEDFNGTILKENKIQDWFEEIKNKYSATLGHLTFTSVKNELLSKLKSLKIKKIAPEDLTTELNNSYNFNVQQIFFSIRTVTDNSVLDKGLKEILSKINFSFQLSQIDLTDEEILQKFDTASLQLKDWKSEISNVNNSHIARDETQKVLSWLSNKVSERKESILMLTGNPGFGKSVILKDTLSELANNNIPVIGIKADPYYATSIENLNELTNLKYPLEKLIKILLKKHSKVVILIDQIDSLSSAVTSNRSNLDVYKQLIDSILSITRETELLKDKVRLVVSIREFDLTYDFEFNYFREFEKVQVEKLTEAQVESVLSKLNLKISFLSSQLLDLIRIPSYLNVLGKIYSPSISLNKINTALDLMNELWVQSTHVLNEVDGYEVKIALYKIVETLSKANQLSIEVNALQSVDRKILNFLQKHGLILNSQKHIQFFHQSLYDYVFARFFVESGKSLDEYIFHENQSIYIRSTLKIMIAYLRQSDFQKYIQLLQKFLFSNRYRFHIQLLIIHELGFLQKPKQVEIDLVTKRLLKRKLFFLPFLEFAVGEKWFPILAKEKALDKLIFPQLSPSNFWSNVIRLTPLRKEQAPAIDLESRKNLWASIMRKAFDNENRTLSLDYLYALKRFENDSNTMRWLLFGLKKWDDGVAFKVFEKYLGNIEEDWYDRLHVIEDAAEYNFEWSLNQLKIVLKQDLDLKGKNKESMYEHHICNIFEKLSKTNKESFFDFGINLIVGNIKKRYQESDIDVEEEDYLYDLVYGSFTLNREYQDDEDNKLIKLIFNDAKELSQIDSPIFKNFLLEYHSTKLTTIQIVLCACYTASPEKYKSYSFKAIKNILLNAPENRALKYYIRNLLSSSFIYFEHFEKKEILDIILQLKPENRQYTIYEGNGKKIMSSFFGYLELEYLSSIPQNELNNYPLSKRRFQELQRKHGIPQNKQNGGPILHRVGPPLGDRAYKYLTIEGWQKSMLRFDNKYKDGRHNYYRGGITEHSREFAKAVESRPEYFYPFLQEIFSTKTVDDEYLAEGLSGLEKAKFDPEKFEHLFKLAIKKVNNKYALKQIIWLSNYLLTNELVDQEIFDFLVYIAIHHSDPEKIKKTKVPDLQIHQAYNTVRGAALTEVIKCYSRKEFSDKIFETVMLSANDPVVSVKLSGLNYMAYLTDIDKEKTLQAFLSYTNNQTDKEIYKHSLNTAHYLSRYNFLALIPYFKNILEYEIELEHLAVILAIAWLLDKEGSYELLQQTWAKSDKAKAKMIDVAIKNFIDSDKVSQNKCTKLFLMFLNDEAKEIVQEYNSTFLHDMSPVHFMDYYSLIVEYHCSKAAKRDPHYYFDYLIKCSKKFPVQCLDLIKCYRDYDKPNHFTGPHYDGSEPIKVVVGALNGLYELENKNIPYITKAMDLFDEMLKDTTYRGSAFDVLNKI